MFLDKCTCPRTVWMGKNTFCYVLEKKKGKCSKRTKGLITVNRVAETIYQLLPKHMSSTFKQLSTQPLITGFSSYI